MGCDELYVSYMHETNLFQIDKAQLCSNIFALRLGSSRFETGCNRRLHFVDLGRKQPKYHALDRKLLCDSRKVNMNSS